MIDDMTHMLGMYKQIFDVTFDTPKSLDIWALAKQAKDELVKGLADELRDKDGKWTKTGGGSVKDVAKHSIDEATKNRPGVTKALSHVAASSGGKMVGLKYAVKGQDSLERKMQEKVDKAKLAGQTMTAQEAADSIRDHLRYTMTASNARYTKMVQSSVEKPEAAGYSFPDKHWKNTWAPDSPYRGLNTTVISPNGQRVELQFHTPESFNLKQESHAKYEEQRLPTTTKVRQDELGRQMSEAARKIKAPPGAMELTKPPR